MATVDPSKFYQPTQWADGNVSLASNVVPNWFAGVQPVSFEDAMAKVQQLQAQELQNERQQLAAEAEQEEQQKQAELAGIMKDRMAAGEDPFDPTDPVLRSTLAKYKSGVADLINLDKLVLERERAQQPQVKGSIKNGLYRQNRDGTYEILSPPQSSSKSTKPNYQYVKDVTGDPVVDPATGQPIVYDKNDFKGMTSALARAAELSGGTVGAPTPGPAPSPTPGDRYLGVDRKTGMKAYLKPDGRTVLRNE